MRTVFLVLFVVIAGFGFLLSDNLHVRQNFTSLQEENSWLMKDRQSMQDQIILLGDENIRLHEQVDTLKEVNETQESQVKSLLDENSKIKEHNILLRTQVDQLTTSSSLARLIVTSPRSLALAIFIPAVPISLGTLYLILKTNRTISTGSNHPGRSSRKVSVLVTEVELQELIRTRRK